MEYVRKLIEIWENYGPLAAIIIALLAVIVFASQERFKPKEESIVYYDCEK